MVEQYSINQFFKIGMDRDVASPDVYVGDKLRVNLGGANPGRMPDGVINCGFNEGWDAETSPLPYADGSVGELWAVHFFEHIWNLVPVLRECERVLETGGLMNIVVPYGACHMAIHDVTHVRMFNEDSFPHLFSGTPYYKPAGDWYFSIVTQFIMAVKGENLALLCQVRKQYEVC